jgi:hypothetical protein
VTYFHEEQRFGRWVWAVLVIVSVPVIVAATGLAGRDPAALAAILVGPLVVALITALFAFAKLVTDVDERGIHVIFHLLWPTREIPLDDVQRAHAMGYSPLWDYGGWGVRLSWKGWAFNTGGAEGVLVETRSGKRIMIGSRRAKDLEDAIAKALAQMHASDTKG